MPHVIIYILSTSIFENTTMTSSLLKLFLYFSSVSSGAPPLPHPHPRTKCKSKVRTKAWSWCERGKFTEGKLPQIQTGWNCLQPARSSGMLARLWLSAVRTLNPHIVMLLCSRTSGTALGRDILEVTETPAAYGGLHDDSRTLKTLRRQKGHSTALDTTGAALGGSST